MKKKLTILTSIAMLATLGSGCAAFTAGVNTARATWNNTVDTVQIAGDKAFAVVGKAGDAAQKIADATKTGAVETVAPATTP